MESRLQTPFKDAAASAHCCDDEGKEDGGCDGMHSTCMPFFYRSGGTSTLFIDLSEFERLVPPSICNEIPVQERFDILQHIARCLLEDFHVSSWVPH